MVHILLVFAMLNVGGSVSWPPRAFPTLAECERWKSFLVTKHAGDIFRSPLTGELEDESNIEFWNARCVPLDTRGERT